MKKVSLCLGIILLVLLGSTACDTPNQLPQNEDQEQKDKDQDKEKKVTPFWGKSWFIGDAEYMFINDNEKKFIRYLPDTLNTSLYLEVKSEDTEKKTINAVVKYSSTSIREMGTPIKFSYVSEDNKLALTADDSTPERFKNIFTVKDMVSYDGADATVFEIPAVKTTYFSNLDGDYTFDISGWKFQVKSKICVEKDVYHYWFAHVVDLQESNGVYNFLLCHNSNADTGVTGSTEKEPFINSQATVWSYMKIYSSEIDGKSNVEWSSKWYSSPYEVLDAELDMKDRIEYSIKEIKYTYKFYFANVGHDGSASNWCCVNKNTEIGELAKIEFTSHIPVTKTWKQILEQANEEQMLTKLPEGKEKDFWWYTTYSIVSNEDRYVYKLSDNYEPSLKEYEFYCALKDKVEENNSCIWTPGNYEATYNNSVIHTLILTNTTLNIDGNGEYTYISHKPWQKGTTYEEYAILVQKDNNTYLVNLWLYYATSTKPFYYKLRAPVPYTGEIPTDYNYSYWTEWVNNGNTRKTASQFYLQQ